MTPPESTDKKVTAITVAPSMQSIVIGGTAQLTATVTPIDATNQNVKWSVKEDSIASVSGSGLVTGKTAGLAHIVASAQDGSNVTGEAQITVTAPTLGSLTVGVTPMSGEYLVTVNPDPEAGNALYYRVTEANGAPTITYDQKVTISEWTAFSAGQKVTGTKGQVMTVVELTTDGKARKLGKAVLPGLAA